eukprot:5372399-Pyramimonas_sp.AAC.1
MYSVVWRLLYIDFRLSKIDNSSGVSRSRMDLLRASWRAPPRPVLLMPPSSSPLHPAPPPPPPPSSHSSSSSLSSSSST